MSAAAAQEESLEFDLITDDDEIDVEIESGDDEGEGEADADTGSQTSASDEELAGLSDAVKKRLEAAEARAKEAQARAEAQERRAAQALEAARKLRDEGEGLKADFAAGEKVLLETTKANVDAQIEAAKKAHKEAFEAGDADKVTEAQALIADLVLRKRQIEAYAPRTFKAPPALPADQAPAKPAPDTRALAWQKENDWFGRDGEMSAVAIAVHNRLTREGVSPIKDADRYYKEIDDTVRRRFPEKFKTADPAKTVTRKPSTTVVAPVTRQATSDGKTVTKVRLNERQVKLAERLGLTPQQYASELAKEMRR